MVLHAFEVHKEARNKCCLSRVTNAVSRVSCPTRARSLSLSLSFSLILYLSLSLLTESLTFICSTVQSGLSVWECVHMHAGAIARQPCATRGTHAQRRSTHVDHLLFAHLQGNGGAYVH